MSARAGHPFHLRAFDVPTLVLHGEDDQIVPVRDSAMKSARIIKGAKDAARHHRHAPG